MEQTGCAHKKNSQGGKENHPGLMQQNPNDPKGKRKNLQTVTNISQHFSKIKRSASVPKQELYSMSNQPRGHCLIINNFYFETNTSLGMRLGTDKDKDELVKVFKKMQFEVEVEDNLNASDMQRFIKQFAEKDHAQMDAFVCCILSHGEKGTVLGVDGKQVEIRDLLRPLAKCCTLAGKPKLIFIQACQGNVCQEAVGMADEQDDGTEEGTEKENAQTATFQSIPIEADFLIGMSTVESYRAFRHIQNGSFYIQELCEQLKIGSTRKEDIHSIMTKVNRIVSSKVFRGRKQMPEVRYTLTKKMVLPMMSPD